VTALAHAGDDVGRRLAALPRLGLNPSLTPLTSAAGLAKTLGGPNVWLKRDDLISFGFGGNKVRGLDFIVADAIKQDADWLVTGAGPLSNHVRATAAAAAHAGLRMTAVYWGNPPREKRGNHLLTEMLGAEIRFTADLDRASVDVHLDQIERQLRAAGNRPYVIPRGGACALGVLGHVDAVREVKAQTQEASIAPDVVVLPVGSGATLAGWLLGSKLFSAPWRIEGVSVSRPAAEVSQRVVTLAREAATLLGAAIDIRLQDVVVHDGFIGAGYGIPSVEGNSAIAMAARAEGIFLDPVYTGKALAAYRTLLSRGRYDGVKTVLFLHTGGQPGLFAAEAFAR
jgi:1-aminocyclopropane-1-carboxylate deaminase/D-cysteine desulfhydrase-like pyridoxal-dependent ACC family enzyme